MRLAVPPGAAAPRVLAVAAAADGLAAADTHPPATNAASSSAVRIIGLDRMAEISGELAVAGGLRVPGVKHGGDAPGGDVVHVAGTLTFGDSSGEASRSSTSAL